MLAAGSAGAALAAPDGTIRPKSRPANLGQRSVSPADGLIERARISGETHFALADMNTGALLEDRSKDIPLPPASVAKTVTTLYALATLGGDYRFRTRLLATGPLVGGKLDGDLILAGGGDPVLDTADLADLATGLKIAGVTEVTGRYLYHANVVPEERQIDAAQPDQVGYNPGLSGLNLNFNRVHFEWKREGGKWVATMDARVRDLKPQVSVATMEIVDRAGPVYTFADTDGRDAWTVASGALGTGGARWLPVRRPAAYTAEVFQVLARSHGIVLSDPQPIRELPEITYQMAMHESPALTEIAEDMLYYSNNMTAEMLGLTASMARARINAPLPPAPLVAPYAAPPASPPAAAAEGLAQGSDGGGLTPVFASTSNTAPETLRDSAAEMSLWARQHLGLKTIDLVDHSGLGDASRISAGDLVTMLLSEEAKRDLQPLLKKITPRDASGRPQSDSPIGIHAKTGTLNFVCALAGYEKAASGRMMVFAIMSADAELRDALTRAQRESPPGGLPWANRARMLQQNLIRRWDEMFGTA
ncbi:hypothetical protein PSAL_031270 [Pseudooceanicola algae]|uniref:Uncharacterized protein n=2 Tax=Pseudooceanicola algae TaxID=1537215 RepID=A0A418SJE4_9RHOB|nr:hypothetical protein PSAL_031270 [Pseudooceanicola algae]